MKEVYQNVRKGEAVQSEWGGLLIFAGVGLVAGIVGGVVYSFSKAPADAVVIDVKKTQDKAHHAYWQMREQLSSLRTRFVQGQDAAWNVAKGGIFASSNEAKKRGPRYVKTYKDTLDAAREVSLVALPGASKQ